MHLICLHIFFLENHINAYKCINAIKYIWRHFPSHSIQVHNFFFFFTFALISYPVNETFSNLTWRFFSIRSIWDYKMSQNNHVSDIIHFVKKHHHLGQDSESEIWERFNFCFKNGSKNKTPPKMLNLNKFLGCFVFAPIFKAKVESFSNFRFWILTQMIMFHYIMDDVWNFMDIWLFWLPK